MSEFTYYLAINHIISQKPTQQYIVVQPFLSFQKLKTVKSNMSQN